MSDKNTGEKQFWYDTETGQVAEGAQRPGWQHVMGPYPTREAAEQALERASRRNEAWEDDDADWRGQG